MDRQISSAEATSLQQLQMQFTSHIRNPELHPHPAGIEDRRMGVYRDLVYNNIENFLSSGFPVIRSIYTDKDWHRMVRDFLINHRCTTPLFLKISEEFITYLQEQRRPHKEDPAGLVELAHYEWVELALSIADLEADLDSINPDGDLLTLHPVLSPLAWPLAYSFPVHRMCRDYLPVETPQALTHLVIYRDQEDAIHFMEINGVTADLLNQLHNKPSASGREILQNIAERLDSSDPEAVINAGLASMQLLRTQGIIPGTTY